MGGRRIASAVGRACAEDDLHQLEPIITGRNPLAPPSLREQQALQTTALWQALQDEARWGEAVEKLVTTWVGDAPASVATQIWNETGTHGF
jgi:hypothetical protein